VRFWLRSLFPKPRRPLTRWSAWSLVVFGTITGALFAWLLLRQLVDFERPECLALLSLTPWIWWLGIAGWSGLPPARTHWSTLIRLFGFAVLVAALAVPRSVRNSETLAVMYVVDLSDSVGDKTSREAIRFVTENVSKKPPKDEAGLVTFGKSAAVELPPRASFPFEALNARIDGGSTNLEQALSLAAAMIPDDRQGRVVLLTDGVETEGSLSRVVADLKARRIAVDVVGVNYEYKQEVWLERIDLPQSVKQGETYEAAVVLSALEPGNGTLVLRENGNEIAREAVEFTAGKNRFRLPLVMRAPGHYEYTATIELPESVDSLRQNNSVVGTVFLEGKGQTLLVVQDPGKDKDFADLQHAILQNERAVAVMSPVEFPRSPGELQSYDSVIFVNVPCDEFDSIQLQAVRDAVFNLGTGFLMVGGDQSFGAGGYNRTVIEELLPVSLDISEKKVVPKGALAIILHTCEFPEGNTWGKRITKQALKVLNKQDEAGVLVYGPQGEDWLFELTSMRDYEKVAPLIQGAEIGDMPSFANTMELGFKGLSDSDAATKHMIIISDGDPAAPPDELVQKFIDRKISVTMIAIFPHGGIDISVMQSVASLTGGRYYKPSDPNALPSIFIKESKTLKRGVLDEKPFLPQVDMPSPILKGLGSLPELKGHVVTTPKGRAQSILQTPPITAAGTNDTEIDPILAVWQYGFGKAAAFTSDLSTRWGINWINSDQYQPFVGQLLTEISQVRRQSFLRVSTEVTGGTLLVTAEDFSADGGFLEVGARISGPGGKIETVPLKQSGSRRYQTKLPLWGPGRYYVAASATGEGRKDQTFQTAIMPYSAEYLRFRSNPEVLERIAKETGGRQLEVTATADDVYKVDRQPRSSSKPVFDWLLTGLAGLLLLDVALRRVQLDWNSITSLFKRKKAASDPSATMETLLERKRTESQRTQQERLSAPPAVPNQPPVWAREPAKPTSSSTAPTTPTAKDSQDQRPALPQSTAERLLEIKRRKQQGNEQ
jgi:Ca-activated chloride channel homolog